MGYIFISYSRRQLYFAESVALTLQDAGLDVWFDLQKLIPGANWVSTLQEGYGNCDRLVLIASRAAFQSPYVKTEWETALHNGREVILVLTEAVDLPDSLKACPIYDARNRFDRTIQSLIAYLCGEQPARRDPVPAPGRFPYPLKLPIHIWLTLSVMFLPSITVWTAVLIGAPYLDISPFPVPALLTRILPKDINPYVFATLFLAVYYGFNLAQAQFPLLEFWRHDAGQKEVDNIRWKLLWTQLIASLVVLVAALLSADGKEPVRPIGYLIFIFPAVIIYWSFRIWGHSPDILRWMPSGEVDQEMREKIEADLGDQIQKQADQEGGRSSQKMVAYTVHHDPADLYNARFIEFVLQAGGCRPVSERQAEVQLILVSNRTSKQWLLEKNRTLPGQIIHILGTNINTPPELQPVLQTQWVDFRKGRSKTLRALSAYLTQKDNALIAYGMQVAPTGFDTDTSFPPGVRLVAGLIAAMITLSILAVSLVMSRFVWELVVLAIAGLFYSQALILRKASLPALLHKHLGHRLAWFAFPAPYATDAIGNQDKKYAYRLYQPFWKDS